MWGVHHDGLQPLGLGGAGRDDGAELVKPVRDRLPVLHAGVGATAGAADAPGAAPERRASSMQICLWDSSTRARATSRTSHSPPGSATGRWWFVPELPRLIVESRTCDTCDNQVHTLASQGGGPYSRPPAFSHR
jgi:hypothetical protein